MTNPLHTLREALGEANNALGWASSMLIEGVEFYTVREVLHAAQKDAMKCHQALTRAEAALREMEADWQVLVEAIGHNAVCSCPKDWVGDGLAQPPRCRRCVAADLIIKRRLADMHKGTN